MRVEPGGQGFLFWDYIDDLSLCDRLIEFHKKSDEKCFGETGGGYHPEVKDSTDLTVGFESDLVLEYLTQLQKVTNKYIEKFPAVNSYAPWTICEKINIQHYAPPNQAFKEWHTERGGHTFVDASRHLVFMTYLNDVSDGGETEWYHQQIKVSPKKGLTVIWPTDWTYTHRGCVSKTEHKYIVTGWYSFVMG